MRDPSNLLPQRPEVPFLQIPSQKINIPAITPKSQHIIEIYFSKRASQFWLSDPTTHQSSIQYPSHILHLLISPFIIPTCYSNNVDQPSQRSFSNFNVSFRRFSTDRLHFVRSCKQQIGLNSFQHCSKFRFHRCLIRICPMAFAPPAVLVDVNNQVKAILHS
jgi:hypothetical protein